MRPKNIFFFLILQFLSTTNENIYLLLTSTIKMPTKKQLLIARGFLVVTPLEAKCILHKILILLFHLPSWSICQLFPTHTTSSVPLNSLSGCHFLFYDVFCPVGCFLLDVPHQRLSPRSQFLFTKILFKIIACFDI